MEKWITVKEAAQSLSVSERNIRFKIQSGKLKAKRDGKKWLVCINSHPNLSDSIGQDADTIRIPEDQVSDTEFIQMLKAEIEKRDKQIEFKDKQISKLQEDLSDASQRHDTIVLQLTRQLEQSQRMLEAHREPWYRRMFKKGRESGEKR